MPVVDLSAYKPVPATLGDANQIANGMQAIQAAINALDNNNFAAGKIFDPAKLMQNAATDGQVVEWDSTAAQFAPAGGLAPWAMPVFQPSGVAALVANTAYLLPIYLPRKMVVTNVNFRIGAQSGNMDLGIYDSGFNRLWSRGSVAVPAVSALGNQIAIAAGAPAALKLAAGLYYLAVDIDNAVATITTVINFLPSTQLGTVLTKAQVLPLPASLAGGAVLGPGNTVAWAGLS